MPDTTLYTNIKGTTSLRLFLFLSLGIATSQYLPTPSLILPAIILPSLFLLAIILHFAHLPRLSILTIYLLLFSYGLLLSNFSLIPEKLPSLHSQLSIVNYQLSIKKSLSPDNLPLLKALILGDRSSLSPDLVSDFRVSGVAHVLVVSGMHVGFIYMLVSFFIRRMPYKRLTTILGIVILWSYAALVGFTLSVCRAVFMFTVLLVMKAVGESYRSFHALFLAAFLQLLITPSALFDIGFQLSYSAVLSILIFYPLFSPSLNLSPSTLVLSPQTLVLRPSSFVLRPLSLVLRPIRLTLSAQILVAPLVAYYFGQFPLYFVLTNLAITLLVPVIFIGGFFLFIPYVGTLLAPIINFLLNLLRAIVSTVASMPMALVQVRLSLLALVLIYLLMALVVCYALTPPSSTRNVN